MFKKFVNLFFTLSLALLSGSCAKKGVDLKFAHTPGDKIQYHLTSEVRTRMSTGETVNNYVLNIDLTVISDVLRLTDKGDAEVQFTYDKIRYLNSQAPEKTDLIIRQLKDTRITVTLSPNGEITDVKGYENMPRMYVDDFNIFTLLLKALPVFPRASIDVGRQWERSQEYPVENGLLKGRMLVYKRFSLLDTLFADNQRQAKIGSEISMKFDLPSNKGFSLAQDGNERLGFDGTGTILFDRDNGQVRTAKAAIFGKMIVQILHPITQEQIRSKIEVAQSISVQRL